MPHDLDEIIQIKEAAEADLLQRPGVTGVDVGYKYVNGNVTDEIVIRVHVEEKKDVPPYEKIPETINGVKTDVLRTRIVATSDTNMYNPLLGGVNIGTNPTPFTINRGTLGAIVIDNKDSTHGMLTNYHVLSHSDGQYVAGDVVTQPPSDLGGGVPAGLVTRGVMNAGADWDHAGEVDCALASVLPISWKNSRGSSNAIVDIGCVAGTAKPKLGETVRKRGFTSELTSGTIDSVALTTIVDMSHIGLGKRYFKNQISIRPDSSQPAFAQSGDSGSVVVNSTGQVIGLLFSADLTTGMGCANPIQTVMDNLNVRMAVDGIGGYDLKSSADRVFTFDYDSSGKLDHLVLYRPGTGTIWILKNTDGQFSPVFTSGSGIGGYDLKISSDRVFAFDYDGSGKLDHLVLYRPGAGTIFILKNTNGQFSPVFNSASGIGGYDLKVSTDQAFAFDYDGSGKLDHLVLYRPGNGTIFILKNTNGQFSSVFTSGSGIGGYDLKISSDRAFAFDYDGSGKLDHLVLYRPGNGTIFILKNTNGQFSPVFTSGSGIGGYDLKVSTDQAFAFDYDGSGKLDHLVLYRPGGGTIFILKNTNGQFSPVFASASGIGGYDLKISSDQAFAFDYTGSGRLDQLVLYRPGAGTIYILKNAPQFSPVFTSGSGIGGYDLKISSDRAFVYDGSGNPGQMVLYRPGSGTIFILKNTNGQFSPVFTSGSGIGGYDLRSSADQAFAFDYDSSGRIDHLVLYRPGAGAIFILKNTNGQFSPVYQQGDPGAGIGGYDLKVSSDRMFAFDYDGNGKFDHLVLYRPGTGAISILKNTNGQFSPVYQQGDPGTGIGGYDLKSPADRVFTFDYNGSGKLDHLVLYRPGACTIWILKNTNGQFSPVFASGSGIGGYYLASSANRAFAFDYDGSGKLDHLVLYQPGAGAISILKNTNGQFSPVFVSGSGIGGYDLRSSDDQAFAFDYKNNGKFDHLVLYRPGTGTIWILGKSGTGHFLPVYQSTN